MKKQCLEKMLWIFRYNTGTHRASHIKLFYALDLEDAKMQVKSFINTIDHIVNEERLEPMPGGFSVASRSFPGRVQIFSDC
jgi:hypothetical protein